MDVAKLKYLKAQGYNETTKSEAVDINEISIDQNAKLEDRLTEYLQKVKNPYVVKYGNTFITLEFPDEQKSLYQCVESYLKGLKSNDF